MPGIYAESDSRLAFSFESRRWPQLAASFTGDSRPRSRASCSDVGNDRHAPLSIAGYAGGVPRIVIVTCCVFGRMRLTLDRSAEGLNAVVVIDRPGESEKLVLSPSLDNPTVLESESPPAEPHEFDARLVLSANGREDVQQSTWRSRQATATEPYVAIHGSRGFKLTALVRCFGGKGLPNDIHAGPRCPLRIGGPFSAHRCLIRHHCVYRKPKPAQW